jgi:hypoxanthine phosphoribosyltransferase
MLAELGRKIEEGKIKYDSVLGIMRGGYIVGLYLSHHLKLPLFGIQVQNHRYNEPERGERKIELSMTEICGLGELGEKVLVVDEIIDRGETMRVVTNKLKDLHKICDTASIICNDCHKPTYYVDSIPEGYWVVFPYEVDSS